MGGQDFLPGLPVADLVALGETISIGVDPARLVGKVHLLPLTRRLNTGPGCDSHPPHPAQTSFVAGNQFGLKFGPNLSLGSRTDPG